MPPASSGSPQTSGVTPGSSAANCADRYQDTTSYFVDPDGEVRTLPFKRAAVHVNRVDLDGTFWDASANYRDLALAGKLGNGKPFRDRRSGRKNLPA